MGTKATVGNGPAPVSRGRAVAAARLVGDLVLALWVGGGALYTFVLTPAIFGRYGRDQAGGIVGALMPAYFGVQLACAAATALLAALLWRANAPRLRGLCLGVAVAALLAQAYVVLALHPEIVAVKARVASFEADPGSPERRRFRALHGRSMAVNLGVIAGGASLIALAPMLRREAGEVA